MNMTYDITNYYILLSVAAKIADIEYKNGTLWASNLKLHDEAPEEEINPMTVNIGHLFVDIPTAKKFGEDHGWCSVCEFYGCTVDQNGDITEIHWGDNSIHDGIGIFIQLSNEDGGEVFV